MSDDAEFNLEECLQKKIEKAKAKHANVSDYWMDLFRAELRAWITTEEPEFVVKFDIPKEFGANRGQPSFTTAYECAIKAAREFGGVNRLVEAVCFQAPTELSPKYKVKFSVIY
jgi:hypothetical protein